LSQRKNTTVAYKEDNAHHSFNVYWTKQDLKVQSAYWDVNVTAGFEQQGVLEEAIKFGHQLTKSRSYKK